MGKTEVGWPRCTHARGRNVPKFSGWEAPPGKRKRKTKDQMGDTNAKDGCNLLEFNNW